MAARATYLLTETAVLLAGSVWTIGISEWIGGPLAFAVLGRFLWQVQQLGHDQNHARK